jgi:hypothetical protein
MTNITSWALNLTLLHKGDDVDSVKCHNVQVKRFAYIPPSEAACNQTRDETAKEDLIRNRPTVASKMQAFRSYFDTFNQYNITNQYIPVSK